MSKVLVLDKDFRKLEWVDWKQAVGLLWSGRAEALDEALEGHDFESWAVLSRGLVIHPNGFVRTPFFRVAVPALIRLLRHERKPRLPAFLKDGRLDRARLRVAPKRRPVVN